MCYPLYNWMNLFIFIYYVGHIAWIIESPYHSNYIRFIICTWLSSSFSLHNWIDWIGLFLYLAITGCLNYWKPACQFYVRGTEEKKITEMSTNKRWWDHLTVLTYFLCILFVFHRGISPDTHSIRTASLWIDWRRVLIFCCCIILYYI